MTLDDLDDLFAIADHLPWMRWASCAEVDPDMFFPELGDAAGAEQAKSVCRRCPVRERCLAYALDNNEEHGIWGGLSMQERRRLRRVGLAA